MLLRRYLIPTKAGKFVRVSGAGWERERHRALRLLTDHFFAAPIRCQEAEEDRFDPDDGLRSS